MSEHYPGAASTFPTFTPETQTAQNVEDAENEAGGGEINDRRSWSEAEDLILVSGWLNTSLDAIIGIDQKGNAFWERISTYYNRHAVQKEFIKRNSSKCKGHWHRINSSVNKFVGCYRAATERQQSGTKMTDIIKVDLDIYKSNMGRKFYIIMQGRDYLQKINGNHKTMLELVRKEQK